MIPRTTATRTVSWLMQTYLSREQVELLERLALLAQSPWQSGRFSTSTPIQVTTMSDRYYLLNPQWRQNLQRLARYGWSFDLRFIPRKLPAALDVNRRKPPALHLLLIMPVCLSIGTA